MYKINTCLKSAKSEEKKKYISAHNQEIVISGMSMGNKLKNQISPKTLSYGQSATLQPL